MNPAPENLRTGFTTGACATAAAKGALLALIHQRFFDRVEIGLPAGQRVVFALHDCRFAPESGEARVIKDAGDDPDVTHGAEIGARVSWRSEPGIEFCRGVGVGLVTKKGLPVPPGEPAINPVPRRMIAQALAEAGAGDRGVRVEIFVPQGEALAAKTFNPRLGIVGGISILGTTGIVVPYSTEAWLASVLQAIDVAKAGDCTQLTLVVGAQGERCAKDLFSLPDDAFVQVGPFFGPALTHAAKLGLARISLVAMIGKLAKFAAGNASVHSTVSAQDFAFLAELAGRAGANPDLLTRVQGANTGQEVAEMMEEAGLPLFFDLLCERAFRFATTLAAGPTGLEVLLLGRDGKVLARYPR